MVNAEAGFKLGEAQTLSVEGWNGNQGVTDGMRQQEGEVPRQ
jgi:hypothetical protein